MIHSFTVDSGLVLNGPSSKDRNYQEFKFHLFFGPKIDQPTKNKRIPGKFDYVTPYPFRRRCFFLRNFLDRVHRFIERPRFPSGLESKKKKRTKKPTRRFSTSRVTPRCASPKVGDFCWNFSWNFFLLRPVFFNLTPMAAERTGGSSHYWSIWSLVGAPLAVAVETSIDQRRDPGLSMTARRDHFIQKRSTDKRKKNPKK